MLKIGWDKIKNTRTFLIGVAGMIIFVVSAINLLILSTDNVSAIDGNYRTSNCVSDMVSMGEAGTVTTYYCPSFTNLKICDRSGIVHSWLVVAKEINCGSLPGDNKDLDWSDTKLVNFIKKDTSSDVYFSCSITYTMIDVIDKCEDISAPNNTYQYPQRVSGDALDSVDKKIMWIKSHCHPAKTSGGTGSNQYVCPSNGGPGYYDDKTCWKSEKDLGMSDKTDMGRLYMATYANGCGSVYYYSGEVTSNSIKSDFANYSESWVQTCSWDDMNGAAQENTFVCHIPTDKRPDTLKDTANVADIAAIFAETDEDGAADDTCNIEGFWSFILCPTVKLMGAATDWFEDYIEKKLGENQLVEPDVSDDIKTLWDKILVVANIGLAIVFLIIIIGTAWGGDGTNLLSNYTVKKALPKLIIGAILVNLSFYICMAVADVVQVVAAGIKQIIEGTLVGNINEAENARNIKYDQDIVGPWSNFAGIVIAGAAAVGGFILIGAGPIAMIVILLILIVLLFLALISFFLVFRQLLLVALVVISPVAFVAMILPNTESAFKKWWNMYWKLLTIYPMFVLIRSMCKAFSVLLGGW